MRDSLVEVSYIQPSCNVPSFGPVNHCLLSSGFRAIFIEIESGLWISLTGDSTPSFQSNNSLKCGTFESTFFSRLVSPTFTKRYYSWQGIAEAAKTSGEWLRFGHNMVPMSLGFQFPAARDPSLMFLWIFVGMMELRFRCIEFWSPDYWIKIRTGSTVICQQLLTTSWTFKCKFMQATQDTHLRICVANITPCSLLEILKPPDSTKLLSLMNLELGKGLELHRIGPRAASKNRRLMSEMNLRWKMMNRNLKTFVLESKFLEQPLPVFFSPNR